MPSLGAVVVVVLAVALLAVAGLLVRSRQLSAWPPIVAAVVTAGICFTVGGNTDRGGSEPTLATVVAAVAGLMTVVAAVLALVPRVARPPLTRMPSLIATAAIVVGAVGLLVNELVS
jgi:hypothetical protein